MNNAEDVIAALPVFQRADAFAIFAAYRNRIKFLESKLALVDAMLDNVEGWCCAELRKDDPEMAAVWQNRVKAIRECRMVTATTAPSTNGTAAHS